MARTQHRVPLLRASLHRFPDPSASRDPRVRELVAQLAALEAGPAPRAHFREELRVQLVAVAPRLVADGAAERRSGETRGRTAAADRAGRKAPAAAERSEPRRGWARPLSAVACAVAVLALLLGGLVWLSRDALPGDMLYGLKRASENVQQALAPGDVARATDELGQASTRYDEVRSLLGQADALALGPGPQAAGAISSHTASLIRSTLGSADDDIRNAMQTLGSTAVRDRSDAPLRVVLGWAPDQVSKLRGIVGRIPSGSLHQRAGASLHLLRAALTRAAQLQQDLGCSCLSGGASDDLGPVPCHTCAAPMPPGRTSSSTVPAQSPATPGRSATRPAGHNRQHGASSTSHHRASVSPHRSGSSHPAGSTTPPPSRSSSSPPGLLPTLHLPTLLPTLVPQPSPSRPHPSADASSCGVGITLGPISIGLGGC